MEGLLVVRCKKCQALLNIGDSKQTIKCAVCGNEITIDSSTAKTEPCKIGPNNELSIIGDEIDDMISKHSATFLDDLLGAAIEKEEREHFQKTSADCVNLEEAKALETVHYGSLIWKVIGIENEKKLLLSKECMGIDFEWTSEDDPFDDLEDRSLADLLSDSPIDYAHEAKEIRDYLNEWFYEKYFSKIERERIVPHCIKIRKADGSVAQELNERIFLLSEEEVQKYLPECKDRIASMHGLFRDVTRDWLLRVDDEVVTHQSIINTSGKVEKVSDGNLYEYFRPAIWVK